MRKTIFTLYVYCENLIDLHVEMTYPVAIILKNMFIDVFVVIITWEKIQKQILV
jgi:hypothetical protein